MPIARTVLDREQANQGDIALYDVQVGELAWRGQRVFVSA